MKISYIAFDGEVFETQEGCEAYERNIKLSIQGFDEKGDLIDFESCSFLCFLADVQYLDISNEKVLEKVRKWEDKYDYILPTGAGWWSWNEDNSLEWKEIDRMTFCN